MTFARDNGLVIASVVAALVLIGLIIYIFINRKRVREEPEEEITDADGFMDEEGTL